jgi:AcrR family transcriptional regulator
VQTRRRQIEDVASELFSSRGYAATSMRDIAGALDLRGASLYAHIPSKEAVLAAIVEEAAEAFHAAARPVAEGPGTATERLREMIAAHVRVVTGARERAKVFLFEWTFLGEERREAIRRSRAAYQGYFERVVAEGVAAGELETPDPRLAAVFILSAMNAMAHWYRPDGALGPGALAGRYADLFLSGLESHERTA